jgi:hypothetical protein
MIVQSKGVAILDICVGNMTLPCCGEIIGFTSIGFFLAGHI